MNNFCLLPDKVDQFKKALKQKEIKVSDLLHLSTEERVGLLREYAGDNAENVNALFESKLVLKNRMLGIKNWASKVGEIGKYSPEGQAQIDRMVSEYRAKQMERILSPKENETFLQTLADKAVGTEVTPEEAKQVFELTSKMQELKKNFDGEKWKSEETRLDYGAAKVALENYTSELKGETAPFKEMVKGRVEQFKKEFGENPAKALVKTGTDALKAISENSIAVVASIDNSFLGRQGLKTLQTHPTAWFPAAKKSFIDIFNTLGGKNALDALMADVYSQPRYMTGEYQKAGILPKTEEQFPTSLPEKIPGLGRAFKASEVAFKGSALRMRMNLYDLVADMAKNQGVKMDDTQIKDIGTVINSLTARGKWGKYGESPIVKLLFWAPRMMKANLDVLTAHGAGAGLETSFARKEAAKNLGKIVGSTALLMAIIYSITKDKGTIEETSTDFGKIKIADTPMSRVLGILLDFVGISSQSYGGKTRLDITGGLGSYVTLASRLLEQKTTSATTGITQPFGSGYGKTLGWDVAINFLTGKTAPIVSAGISIAKGKDFQGKKPTVSGVAQNLLVPISIQNILEFNQQDQVDWNQTKSKEMTDFKAKVGQEKFNQANQEYNDEYNKRFERLTESGLYKSMNDEEKQKAVIKLKNEIKSNTLKNYGFKK